MGGSSPRVYHVSDELPGPVLPEKTDDSPHYDQLQKLKVTLEANYPSLIRRLSKTLRSHDRATDALHDAYIKLMSAPAIGEVRNPLAYLYRMTINLAYNVRARESRMTSTLPEIIGSLADDASGPERTAMIRHDLKKLLTRLQELPKVRREIFLARWRDEMTHDEIAKQMRLHKRTVQKQLAKAEHFLRSSATLDE